MWEGLHEQIKTLVWQGIQEFDACDGTDKEVLAYAFLKDLGYDVTEFIKDDALVEAMEATATIDDGLLLFWKTIAPLDYSELQQRYLVDDFEWQLAETCWDIFNQHVSDYLTEQADIARCAGQAPWLGEYL